MHGFICKLMKSCRLGKMCYSITTHADWKNCCWLLELVVAGIFLVIVVGLWIIVGVKVPNFPNASK